MKEASRYILALVILTSVPSAFAGEPPKEGTYDYTACWTSTRNDITFSKTHTSSSYEMTGSIRSTNPGGMFDKESFRCVGMNASLGGKNTASTVCEATDADGNKRLTSFSVGSDGKVTREFVAGTGKYEGMVTTGTVEPLGPFPVIKAGTVQDCNHQTGAYKLK
jgi:hypothetical protein